MWNSDNSSKSIQTIKPETIQPILQNAKFENKKSEMEFFLGLRPAVGALSARRHFASITGSKFCIFGWIVCI